MSSPPERKSRNWLEFDNQEVKVIGVYNFKGGVGKTMTALNLGVQLARTKGRTLLVDCDAQCNLTFNLKQVINDLEEKYENQSSGINIDNDQEEEDDIMTNELIQHFKVESPENVYTLWLKYLNNEGMRDLGDGKFEDIIGTLVELIQVEENLYLLAGSHRVFNIDHWITNRQNFLNDKFKFINMITRFAKRLALPYVIIDLNPGNLMINKSILCRSNHIITPIFPDQSSVSSTIIFIDEIYKKLKEFCRNDDFKIRCLANLKHIVVNRFKSRKDFNGNKVVVSLHASWIKILKKFIRRRDMDIEVIKLSPQFESTIMKKRDGKYSLIRNAGEEQWKIDYFIGKLIVLCNEFE